jgi:Protein SOSEKI 2, plant
VLKGSELLHHSPASPSPSPPPPRPPPGNIFILYSLLYNYTSLFYAANKLTGKTPLFELMLSFSSVDRPNQINTNPKPANQVRPKHDGKNLSRHKSKEASQSSLASPPPPSTKHANPLSPLSLSSSRDEQQSPSSFSSGHHSPDHLDTKFHKTVPSADAWTQTDEETVTRSRSISMDDTMLLHSEATSNNRKSSCGKSETLESLIRAEGRKFNQLGVLQEDEEVVISSGPRLSPASYLMHLISCGSISVKDHRQYGFIPIYRPSYVQVALPSPMYGTGSVSFLTRMEDKEYFSGSIVETKKHIDETVGDRVPVLKRSSSYNADR